MTRSGCYTVPRCTCSQTPFCAWVVRLCPTPRTNGKEGFSKSDTKEHVLNDLTLLVKTTILPGMSSQDGLLQNHCWKKSRQLYPTRTTPGQPLHSTHLSRLDVVRVNVERNILVGTDKTRRRVPQIHGRYRTMLATSVKDTGVSSVLGQNRHGHMITQLSPDSRPHGISSTRT